MEVNAKLVKKSRINKGWTQQQLAEIADVSLRTIQRIESTGSASHESVSALCSSFELEREDLLIVPRVEAFELKPIKLGGLYLMLIAAMFSGITLGAITMYFIMVK